MRAGRIRMVPLRTEFNVPVISLLSEQTEYDVLKVLHLVFTLKIGRDD